MQLHRFELDYLTTWLERKSRKPLIIRGARQVGKSTLVKLLAQKNNLDLIEIDFELEPEKSSLFISKDPSKIIKLLETQINKPINRNKTLLFLDEIQKTPEIIASLRYFYEKMPELAIICAGSLLDVSLRDINFSMPVGRIEYLYLGPMTFEDFILALGKNQLLEFIRAFNLGDELPIIIHNQLLDLVKTYCIVGGLPEAIARYIETDNFIEVARSKNSLLNSYQEDFAKYATLEQQNRMCLIFEAVPRILGEKIKYSNLIRDNKSVNISEALDKLVLAKIITKVTHTDANGLPLGAEVNNKFFKAYFLDIGLVSTALGLNIINLVNHKDLTLVNSGKISEQFVAQHLLYFHELYETPTLYYWQRGNKSAKAEIDFIIAHNGAVIPIEVKAGTSGSLKSLHYFLKEKKLDLGVRFCSQKPSLTQEQVKIPNSEKYKKYRLLSLPFYMVGELKRLLGIPPSPFKKGGAVLNFY